MADNLILRSLSSLYGAVVGARNTLFNKGVFKPQAFGVPVISVGNISVGGTGKTPVVAHLTSHFRSLGKKVCIVSRGYHGSYSTPSARVEPDLEDAAALFGDEPTWFAKNLSVPVFVARSRRKAVEHCLRDGETGEKPDLIIADDGFQHRWLHRFRDIVLLDATEDSAVLLPAGRFREPLSSLRRADLVILTKINLATAEQKDYWVEAAGSQGFSVAGKNLFFAEWILRPLKNRMNEALKPGQAVILASAIARPESFEKLAARQAAVLKHFVFADHHSWAQKDIDQIKAFAKSKNCAFVAVTEKDFVKINRLDTGGLELLVAELEINLQPDFPYEKLTN